MTLSTLATRVEGLSGGNYARCDACGRTAHIDSLDGKPSTYPKTLRGQWRRLIDWWHDNDSRDFDRLECAACYGPGYVDVRHERATLTETTR